MQLLKPVVATSTGTSWLPAQVRHAAVETAVTGSFETGECGTKLQSATAYCLVELSDSWINFRTHCFCFDCA